MLVTVLALLQAGCAHRSHRAATCPNPARVVGDPGGTQGGWVLVRGDQPVADTAARVATTFHVRTQSLTYVHGFSTYPVPEGAKFLCDKAIAEVHYAPSQSVSGR
jgi:hypothetical protein